MRSCLTPSDACTPKQRLTLRHPRSVSTPDSLKVIRLVLPPCMDGCMVQWPYGRQKSPDAGSLRHVKRWDARSLLPETRLKRLAPSLLSNFHARLMQGGGPGTRKYPTYFEPLDSPSRTRIKRHVPSITAPCKMCCPLGSSSAKKDCDVRVSASAAMEYLRANARTLHKGSLGKGMHRRCLAA